MHFVPKMGTKSSQFSVGNTSFRSRDYWFLSESEFKKSGDAFDPERAPQKSEGQWTGLLNAGCFSFFATHVLTDG